MLMGVVYLLVTCKKKIKHFKSSIRYNESLIRMNSLSIASNNATIVSATNATMNIGNQATKSKEMKMYQSKTNRSINQT